MELTLNASDCDGRGHIPVHDIFILPKNTPNAQIITYNLNGTQPKSIELHLTDATDTID
jgi:hypothetical protein